jgi:hypothetical protein
MLSLFWTTHKQPLDIYVSFSLCQFSLAVARYRLPTEDVLLPSLGLPNRHRLSHQLLTATELRKHLFSHLLHCCVRVGIKTWTLLSHYLAKTIVCIAIKFQWLSAGFEIPHSAMCCNTHVKIYYKNVKKITWAESVSELYRSSDRSLSEKLMPTFADRGCCAVSSTDPHGRILGFLDRSRYFFFQVAPQLYSRGWVDPVPDPLLLRKSGSAANRTWVYL